MNFKIREAVAADISQMCRLFQKDLGYPECDEIIVEKNFSSMDNSREAVFVAVTDDQKICGVIHIEKYRVLYFPTMANILGLAVSAEFRRQGIGSALLLRAEQWAKENGIGQMRLNSGGTRKEAHEFYRAQGYNDEKTQLRFVKVLN